MRNVRQILSKELSNYSKDELIRMLTSVEEKYNSKIENLRQVHSKLTRARVRIQAQNQRLQHLRRRVVEATQRHQTSKPELGILMNQIKG